MARPLLPSPRKLFVSDLECPGCGGSPPLSRPVTQLCPGSAQPQPSKEYVSVPEWFPARSLTSRSPRHSQLRYSPRPMLLGLTRTPCRVRAERSRSGIRGGHPGRSCSFDLPPGWEHSEPPPTLATPPPTPVAPRTPPLPRTPPPLPTPTTPRTPPPRTPITPRTPNRPSAAVLSNTDPAPSASPRALSVGAKALRFSWNVSDEHHRVHPRHPPVWRTHGAAGHPSHSDGTPYRHRRSERLRQIDPRPHDQRTRPPRRGKRHRRWTRRGDPGARGAATGRVRLHQSRQSDRHAHRARGYCF